MGTPAPGFSLQMPSRGTYIYSIKDNAGSWVEGFDSVGKVTVQYYCNLLGPKYVTRTPIVKSILQMGPLLTMDQLVTLC